MNCYLCHRPMRLFAPNADHPDELSAECIHDDCDLCKVTLPCAEHATMNDALAQSYIRMNRAFQQRRAAFEVREQAVRA